MDKTAIIRLAVELADELEERVTDEDNAKYIEQVEEAVLVREDIAILNYLAYMVRGGHTAEDSIAQIARIWADIDSAGAN